MKVCECVKFRPHISVKLNVTNQTASVVIMAKVIRKVFHGPFVHGINSTRVLISTIFNCSFRPSRGVHKVSRDSAKNANLVSLPLKSLFRCLNSSGRASTYSNDEYCAVVTSAETLSIARC